MNLAARKAVEARKLGTTLVATFHRANPPVIWRFDLERNHSFTLSLQGEESEWELGLASPRGEFHPIARFAQRDEADESFTALSDLIATGKRPWWGFLLSGLGFGFAAMFVVMLLFGALILHNYWQTQEAVAGTPIQTASPVNPDNGSRPAVPTGIPQAADDVLTPP